MKGTKQVVIEIPVELWELYLEADKEIEKRLGQSPGPEFLMSLLLEQDDPLDLVVTYVNTVIQHVSASGP